MNRALSTLRPGFHSQPDIYWANKGKQCYYTSINAPKHSYLQTFAWCGQVPIRVFMPSLQSSKHIGAEIGTINRFKIKARTSQCLKLIHVQHVSRPLSDD